MRIFAAGLVVLLGLGSRSLAQSTPPCTGLCLQQVTCPSGTTTVSGIVYAPNGTDPLPNVAVYIPNAPVDAFTPGVSCPVIGQPPSGSPLVGTTTAVDGSFSIPDVPVGTSIPLVIVSGRWRRQLVIPAVTACVDNPLPSTPVASGQIPTAFAVFPSNQSQGDIPKIAIASGSADSVECVLRKVGIADSEFTDPAGNSSGYIGRVNMFLASGSPGANIDGGTPSETTLMSDPTNATLSGYDVLMLPCEGGVYTRTSTALLNLASFANVGGRVYASHYAYTWMDTPQTFSNVAKWTNNSANSITSGTAMVNASFSGGATLSTWLTEVGASTTPGQIAISTIRTTQTGVNSPTESWLSLIDAAIGNPVMQFVWDTPVVTTATTNQCGRVLFNEYHVENPATTSTGKSFPTECSAITTAITPQEKLLEYSLFELTNDGGAFTLTPTTQDFGTEAVGFNSPVQTFTWTNNSTFTTSVTLLSGSGDFTVVGNNCTSVLGGNSCLINVVFNPSAVGARTGTLTVGSNGTTLTASLTGTGIPDLVITPPVTGSLTFGSLDVGASQSQTLTVVNTAPGSVPVPATILTGDYTATNNCGVTLAKGASCLITVTFTPTSTGTRPGMLTFSSANVGVPTTITGNGVDFTITDAPASGSVIAGYNTSTVVTTTPLAGFASNLGLTCKTNAPGSTCLLNAGIPGVSMQATTVTITTISQYTVIGYGGLGGSAWLSLLGLGSGVLIWMRRRGAGNIARASLTVVLLAVGLGSFGLTGCAGHLPSKNVTYTPATGTAGTAGANGPYTYTITATDGFLVHSATYALTVTVK